MSIGSIFTTILIQPILNLLVWLYTVLPGQDMGLAIIAVTVVIKLILYPVTQAQLRQQRALQSLQPKIEEVRARLKDDKEAQAKELMALYAKEKVNPAASCLPLLIQLPVFIALYQSLLKGMSVDSIQPLLYTFIPEPQMINTMFLGLIDLTKPSYVLAVIAGIVQFVQGRQMIKPPAGIKQPPKEVEGKEVAKDESMAAMMNKQMLYFMPIVTVIIGVTLPGGLALYWFMMGLLTLAQQWWVTRLHKNDQQTPSLPSSTPSA